MPVLTTIDLTEDDSRDSSQSSSTLSGSSSQEGQNGSAELVAEEPESREAGIALEYQVRGAPCSAASPLSASPSPCAGQWVPVPSVRMGPAAAPSCLCRARGCNAANSP